jgi:hypothetical protein
MIDLGTVAQDVVPYLSAAAAVYGKAVVEKATDAAGDAGAEATVSLGRRLLRRLSTSQRAEQIREAVTEVGDQPDDEASVDILRAQVLKALKQEPELAHGLAELLREAGVVSSGYHVTITGSQGVQVGSGNTQTNTFQAPPA